MRVITELVINHTSDQHPWFQRARQRQARLAGARLLRLVRHRPEIPGHAHHLPRHREVELDLGPGGRAPIIWHRFYSHQPDLNFDNPRVLEAVLERHALLARHRRRRAAARRRALPGRARGHQQREPAGDARGPEAASAPSSTRTIPTACCWPRPTSGRRTRKDYFGDGDECHMAFHFPLMPRMYMAIAQRGPLPDHRHHAPDAGDPATTASGRSSCATTTS